MVRKTSAYWLGPGSRLPGLALLPIVQISDGLAIKSIGCNGLRRSKRLPSGRQALPGVPPGGTFVGRYALIQRSSQ